MIVLYYLFTALYIYIYIFFSFSFYFFGGEFLNCCMVVKQHFLD